MMNISIEDALDVIADIRQTFSGMSEPTDIAIILAYMVMVIVMHHLLLDMVCIIVVLLLDIMQTVKKSFRYLPGLLHDVCLLDISRLDNICINSMI